jgi:ketosteroid isomerase-like protein
MGGLAVKSGRMRRLAPTFLLLALLGCAHTRGFADGDRDAIVDLLRAQQDAWNRGDLDEFLRGYEPGPALVFTSGGKIRRGLDETRARYESRYRSAGASHATNVMGHLEFEVLSVRGLGRDGAVVLGRWRLTRTPEAGAGVFSLALLRTHAGWRIVHDHTSTDTP